MIAKKIVPFFLLISISYVSAWRSFSPSDTYGRPCVNGTVPEGSKLVNCDREARSLVCSVSGKCECAPSELATVYDEELKACLLVPYPEDGFRCRTDFQCHVSSYGRFSRCSLDTGTCECSAPNGSPTELLNNVCYLVRPIAFSAPYPSCRSDAECQRSDIGLLSRCNMEGLKCECYDSVSNGKNDVGYYAGVCVLRRKLGAFCNSDAECRAVHPGTSCRAHDSYLGAEKICQCDREKCDGDVGNGGVVLATSFLVWVVALVI